MKELRVALTAGAMYDPLYERLSEFARAHGVTVRIGFRGPHPELNAHLAENGAAYHLVSTHTKYAPSQADFLAPLDGLDLDLADFFPAPLELASIDGRLYGIPRNIDLRLLHYRTDLLDAPPATWEDLLATARRLTRPDLWGFVFTGMESGLFGTFFEWVELGGSHLFPPSLVAQVHNAGGRWALGLLRGLYTSGAVPAEVADWQYHEVHTAFRDGHAAMVCDWPGYYASYTAADSAVRDRFRVARMPAGPDGRRLAYSGSHTFALTRSGVERPEAVELLRFLTAPAQQRSEAQRGSVPVRASLMAECRATANGAAAERWQLLETAIAHDLIIPPKLAYYPLIEDILWRTVRAAMIGELAIDDALVQIEQRIAATVEAHG
jgi:multiple sugar transport system substrate-binding protein